MALEVSTKARLLSQKVNIEQQVILEIDGIPFIFGAQPIFSIWEIGQAGVTIGQTGLKIGGGLEDPNSRDWISLEGTTNSITQQLEVDKGDSQSVQKFNVQLIDKDSKLTNEIFTPGVLVSDLLGREANVFINFAGGNHPEDSIRIFNGIIDSTSAGAGFWKLAIAHPDSLKRSEIFQQIQTKLVGSIGAGDTSLVYEAGSFVSPSDAVSTYLIIDDEIIQYTTVDTGTNTISGLTRGEFGTIAAAHADETEISSAYRLIGQPLDLALKIMLTTEDGFYAEDLNVTRFVDVSPTETITDGIFIPDTRLVTDKNVTTGDLITVIGATNPASNVTDAVITQITQISTGTVLHVDGEGLVSEIEATATATLKSKYDTLPGSTAGLGMKPSQVDIQQHESLAALFAASQPDYDFFLKETENGKDFISQELYFPAGYIAVPRKARASVNIAIPPLALEELTEYNTTNVKSANKIQTSRQITKEFFNTIVYRFEQDQVEDDFKSGQIIVSNRSRQRIKTNTKTLTINSRGLRDNDATRNFIQTQAKRYNDRFQFAPYSTTIQVNYKSGFDTEITDVVLFGEDLQISNHENASRSTEPQLYEVVNRSFNLKTGDVKLRLLQSGYGIDGRFGTISPSSFIGTGSSTTQIIIKRSFGTGEFELETSKWVNFVGEQVEIRTEDYSFRETVTLTEIDPTRNDALIVNPPLSVAPPEDYLVDFVDYTGDTDVNPKEKGLHCFWDPQVEVVSGISATEFTVAPADITKFFVGSYVRVHNEDYSIDSNETSLDDDARVTIVDTGTNTVTVDRDLTFTPVAGYFVDLIGFSDDGGLPYRYV